MFRVLIHVAMASLAAGPLQAQTREQKVRADRQRVEAEGKWIYNDLAKGIETARSSGKPIIAALRCIPCEECVKLDDEILEQDPRLQPLLERFVRVRLISTNGLDLGLFQFDYDQSFAVFFLNADGAILGRFGTRSHRTLWADDVSVDGLAKAMQGALELHAHYAANREALAAKKGPKPAFASPEKYPTLRDKYGPTLNYAGNVVPSCIHCHQIGDAQRELVRQRREPIPEQLLFPYPHPKAIGLILDPREMATVQEVKPDSPAAAAGFQKGDVILALAGQPLLSIADVQWVLHQASPEGAEIKASVRRGAENREVILHLAKGWRERDDFSWRASAWTYRRMAAGGLLLKELTAADRQRLKLADSAMALRVEHVGQYGPHAAAKNAGFREGDVLVSFDGRTDLMRETDLLAYALRTRLPGEQVPVEVIRGGQKLTLKLPMQD